MTTAVPQNETKVVSDEERNILKEKDRAKSGLTQRHSSNSTEKSEKEARKSIFVQQIQDHDEMSGYLYKRRGGFGRHMPNAWQLRYFTLRDGIMYYFEDSGGIAKPRGKIDLKSEHCTFYSGVTVEGAPSLYTMQIVPGGLDEKWKLCAQSKEDMELWVSAIMRHITDEQKRKPAPLDLKEYESDDENDGREGTEDETPSFVSPVRPPPPAGDSTCATPHINKPMGHSQVEKSKGKRKLKLQTDVNGGSEEIEFVMVLVVLNLSAAFAVNATLSYGILFLLLTNIVVARTLYLRAARLRQQVDAMNAAVKAATAAASAHAPVPSTNLEKEEDSTGAPKSQPPQPGTMICCIVLYLMCGSDRIDHASGDWGCPARRPHPHMERM